MLKERRDDENRHLLVGVIGGARVNETQARHAYEVGRCVGERGMILVCGGMSGVMEAACQGAVEAGGITVGIVPTDDPADANPYVQIPIVTGMGIARNAIIARTADVLIAVGGSYGTLSEIAIALNLGRRVVHLGSWDIAKAGQVDPDLYVKAADPEDAVEKALGTFSK